MESSPPLEDHSSFERLLNETAKNFDLDEIKGNATKIYGWNVLDRALNAYEKAKSQGERAFS
ncbi:MAG: hypothetical protein HWD61_12825 [Parachlamydiaceae bacterium]|nr:MAG: hypothetical protein HWD61_12825 [Parachlamydiaceae bacterium]